MTTNFKFYLLLIVAFVLDQLSKHLVPTFMFTQNIGFFRTTNTGAGFSILSGNNILLAIITSGFIIYLFWYLHKEKKTIKNTLPFALILAGAFGNVVDRVIFGHVFDFIRVYSFPVFNLADSWLTLGVIWLLWIEYHHRFVSKPKK